MREKKYVDVPITAYSSRGHGIASLDNLGTNLQIPNSVIGDQLRISWRRGRKRRGCKGRIQEIITPSPHRVLPRCVHAMDCGGCSWQQLDYSMQLQHKENIVRELFCSFLDRASFSPIISASSPWEYRNKMEFSFSEDKEGKYFLGLNSVFGSRKVIDLEECHLVSSWFTKVLSAVREWWEGSGLRAYHFTHNTGTVKTLTLREGKRTKDKMIILTVSGAHEYFLTKKQLKTFTKAIVEALPDQNPSIFLSIHRIKKRTPSTFYEMHLSGPDILLEKLQVCGRNFTFHISPASFFQPNPHQAEKLFTRALEMARLQRGDRVYDLYCGGGVIGTLVSPYVKKVIGIESNPYAVCDAKRNIEANQVENISIIKGEVEEVLSELNLSPDLAIVDPPRAGIGEKAISHLLRLSPERILYISCNPVTQRDNVAVLVDSGYKLVEVQSVDQFPHTPHIENIVYLKK